MEPQQPRPTGIPAAASPNISESLPPEKKRSKSSHEKRDEVIVRDTLKNMEVDNLKYKYLRKRTSFSVVKQEGNAVYKFATQELQLGKRDNGKGETYWGHFKDMVFHGKGVLQTADREYFDGEWKNGKLDGPASYYNKMGHVFSGEIKDGRWVGEAQIRFRNGDLFKGIFSSLTEREGKGFLMTKTKVYEGVWEKDKFTGGRISYTDSPVYIEYQGEVRADNFHGKGKLILRDGRTIDGEFNNGVCINGTATKVVDGNPRIVQTGRIEDYLKEPRQISPALPRIRSSSDEPRLESSDASDNIPAAARKKKRRKEENPAQANNSELPGPLPSFREFTQELNEPVIRIISTETQDIAYLGEMKDGSPHGSGKLVFKNMYELARAGIHDPSFMGIFDRGMPYNGEGLIETVLSDGSRRMSYGIIQDSYLYTGIGFIPSVEGTWCGVFENGKMLIGHFYPVGIPIPGATEIFMIYSSHIHNLNRVLADRSQPFYK